jgi:hypothetical protein
LSRACTQPISENIARGNEKDSHNIAKHWFRTTYTIYLKDSNIKYQLAAPGQHRINAAKRAIRTFKNHFIAGLCIVDDNFPINLWDRLLPQALVTINLLQGSAKQA